MHVEDRSQAAGCVSKRRVACVRRALCVACRACVCLQVARMCVCACLCVCAAHVYTCAEGTCIYMHASQVSHGILCWYVFGYCGYLWR